MLEDDAYDLPAARELATNMVAALKREGEIARDFHELSFFAQEALIDAALDWVIIESWDD
jgi:hypothetical protein